MTSHKYLIKRGLSKAKIVDFVRRKLNKQGAKVRYIKRKTNSKKKTKKKKVIRGRKVTGDFYPSVQSINQLVSDRLDKQAEQIERQAEALATPAESELFRQTKQSLVLMARNAGIKYPYRKTKLQLISDLTELSSGTKLEDIERKYEPEDKKPRGRPPKPLPERLVPLEKTPSDSKNETELKEKEVKEAISPVKSEPKPRRGRPPGVKNKPKPSGEPIMDEPVPDTELKLTDAEANAIKEAYDAEYPEVTITEEEAKALADAHDAENAYGERERKEFFDKYGYGVRVDNTDALSNIQIDKIMSPYGDKYLGCCSCDTIEKDILPKVKPESKGCFVVNTDNDKGPGEHWCSVFFDATPNGSHSIEFFDSYGDDPDKPIDKGIQAVAHKLNCQNYLKYKINSVCWQGNKMGTKKESSNCGYFAVKFLIDRLRGKSFQESTCYDASKIGEKNIEKFKDGEGIRKSQIGGSFGLLPSFGDVTKAVGNTVNRVKNVASTISNVAQNIKEKIFFPAREFSNAFKSIMSKYGNLRIKSARIRRAPIGSAINSLLNILSLGKFEEYRKEKNFDKYFHLGIVLELEGGKKLLLEKNAKPEFSENFKDSNDTVYMGPISIRGTPTLNEFIQKTVDKNSIYTVTNYDPFKNNCQAFILMLLEANNSLTPALKNFIYQDVSTLLERIPSVTDKIARFATDTGAKLQELIGQGKPRSGADKHKRKFTTARRKAIKKLFKNILS